MSDEFMQGLSHGCLYGCALVGVVATIAGIWLGANGYRVTHQPPEPVLVPIDCKVVA